MSQNSSSSSGVSLLSLFGILFVGLKLTGHINWSWWYVTAPFWGGLAVLAMGLLLWGLYALMND